MSTDLGNRLPDDLFAALTNVDSLSEGGTAIPICSTADSGWPHPALLSYGEISARDRTTLRVITFDGTTTTRNLRANGKLTLIFIDASMIYYVKGTASPASDAPPNPGVVPMDVAITHVLSDTPGAGEEGARITSGITFEW